MRNVIAFPPNFEKIKLALPQVDFDLMKPVFSYEGIIYNPYDIKITPDLERHEEVHYEQQGNMTEVWWDKYLLDKRFRFAQELEAYGEQCLFAMKNGVSGKMLEWALDSFANQLSSVLYGSLCSFGEARSKIRNYAKSRADV